MERRFCVTPPERENDVALAVLIAVTKIVAKEINRAIRATSYTKISVTHIHRRRAVMISQPSEFAITELSLAARR